MAHFLIGSLITTAFILIILYVRKKSLKVAWWQWILTVLGFIYLIFVLEVIVSFLDERAGRAALVIGLALGFIAFVWAVLLGRFVFTRKSKLKKSHTL
jgi:hypothetical protein